MYGRRGCATLVTCVDAMGDGDAPSFAMELRRRPVILWWIHVAGHGDLFRVTKAAALLRAAKVRIAVAIQTNCGLAVMWGVAQFSSFFFPIIRKNVKRPSSRAEALKRGIPYVYRCRTLGVSRVSHFGTLTMDVGANKKVSSLLNSRKMKCKQ